MKRLLWLDDRRNPFEGDWLKFSPIEKPFDTIWIKSYSEFVKWIKQNGLPDGICFDNDLGLDENPEKTGYDCAKWLVEYCLDNGIREIPKWNTQSSNPAGRDNINGLFVSFIKNN